MPNYYKGSYILQGGGSYGWSESFYLQATDLAAARRVFIAPAYIDARARLMGNGVEIVAVKVFDLQGFRVSTLDAFYQNAPDLLESPTQDTPWQSYQFTLEAGALYSRTQHLRGLPDAIVTTNNRNQHVMNQGWMDRLGIWIAAVKAGQYRMRALFRPPEGNLPLRIENVLCPDDGYVTITTSAAHGLAVGDFVNVRGLRGQNFRNPIPYLNVNGIWRVRTLDEAFTFTIPVHRSRLPGPLAWIGGGTVSKRLYGYPAITNWQPGRVSRKIPGRAFFQQRARRSVPRTL